MRQKCTIAHIWGVIYPALLYLGITYLVQIAIIIGASFMIGFQYAEQIANMSENEFSIVLTNLINEQLLLITAISAFVAIPIGFMFMYLDIIKEKELGIYRKYTGYNPLHYLLIIPLAFTSMLAGNLFVSIVQIFLPQEWVAVYDETAEILYGAGIGVQILATVIAAPIIEELIFRGLIYKRIKRVSNTGIAIILSALFFGIFHWNVVQGIYAFIVGAILAYIYEKYKSIIAPILFHMTANFISVLSMFLLSEEELEEASQETVYSVSQLNGYLTMMLIMAALTGLLLFVINRTVKLREIKEA